MAYGSQKEGVGLTLLREIKEGFMEEMTSEYSLKARKSGERVNIPGRGSSKYAGMEAWERMVPSGGPLEQLARRASWQLRQVGTMCRGDHKKPRATS